jgi:hypothetical protein
MEGVAKVLQQVELEEAIEDEDNMPMQANV